MINWLTNFTPESIRGSNWKAYLDENEIEIGKAYRAILQTIAHHEPVTTEAISFFKAELTRVMNSDAVIFPLKHSGRDENGLTRLLIKCGFKSRIVDFEKMARPLFAKDCTGKELVILLDTTISGNQAKIAFEHYLTVYTVDNVDAREIANRDRYFEFKSWAESEMFRKNMQVIADITIVTPILTTAGRKKIESLPVFSGKTIKWLFHEEITEDRYLFEAANFDVKNKEIVEQLLLDHSLINKLFIVADGTNLETYNNNPKKMNIMLRVGSLHSKHMRVFSLKPQNGSKSLFEYIDNWSA